ncbi:tRNA-splicing endonuclease subunit Sen2 [Galleria mellonella]|uniref:tRNA-splicing endonuclease subunit Sen2 n=1 Tax=Galleria mellonella TaxID=7137 RepID=A0A6J3BZ08_GALME|nr:tRNA-splicing endonuclease subunit Sen2 [Galleria mellonella]XP_031764855.2 tRNA-splicing endonuclease subunit Sen2 [Galleria mellonella]XP_052756999.1 tRNA-splicing endonuclease subunit Sen2 [Galleria mellonella]
MTTMQTGKPDDCQNNDSSNLFPMTIDSLRFPLDSTMRIIFTGYFNGIGVEVRSVHEMALLYQMGCFGKGSFSRSKPKRHQSNDSPQIMRKRQFLKRNYWYKKFNTRSETTDSDLFFKEIDELSAKIVSDCENKNVIDLVSSDEDDNNITDFVSPQLDNYNASEKQDMVVVVANSDSEEEDYFANLKPQCCLNKTKLEEKLMLTLQEAFFLLYGLGCLQVVHADKVLNIEQCLELFTETDKHFVTKYVVYHYFRSKGYVVKSGIKFGGDYLLYKDGPGVAHAEFIVIIRNIVEKNSEFNWVSVLGHNRMAVTTLKKVIIAEVVQPNSEIKIPEGLCNYSVRELLLTRNIPVTLNDDFN